MPLGWGLQLVANLAIFYILVAPYTKVEESFNIQAVHDLCQYGSNITAYDHMDFPGVVPRSFIGALAIAVPACPIIKVSLLAGFSKLAGLYIARLILAGYSVSGLWFLKTAVSQQLDEGVGNAFVLVLCSQFHVLYYASRPLPNTFALPLVAVAIGCWLRKRDVTAICILTFATVVIRCDLAPFLGIMGLQMLLSRRLPVLKAVLTGLAAAVISLLLTVSIDSIFWQQWLWPEGSVLWFNTAENRSSEWGTQPIYWYFTSALPRALLGALPLLGLGVVVERRTRTLTAVTLLYIGLYSLLPHKELRFLLSVLPLLNIPAAAALAWLWRQRARSTLWNLTSLAAAALLALNLTLTVLFLTVSRDNYPGGKALLALHDLRQNTGAEGISVHIDVLPAMTGVTRFGELSDGWQYSKEENLNLTDFQARRFSFLLSSHKEVPGYALVDIVSSFSHISLKVRPIELWRTMKRLRSPVQILQRESVYIHELLLV